jgi:hypothetical protein
MISDEVMEILLQNFPDNETISYDDFTQDDENGLGVASLFENKHGAIVWTLVRHAYELISLPWSKINWINIASIADGDWITDSWMIPSFLNEKSFKHSFPSLLKFSFILHSMPGDEYDGPSGLLVGSFIDQLNLNEINQSWKREFYLSLSQNVRETVGFILRELSKIETPFYIDSYWC